MCVRSLVAVDSSLSSFTACRLDCSRSSRERDQVAPVQLERQRREEKRVYEQGGSIICVCVRGRQVFETRSIESYGTGLQKGEGARETEQRNGIECENGRVGWRRARL